MTIEFPIPPPPHGRLVNRRYRLLRQLGRGGMGAVWLAQDTLLERLVALKEIVLSGIGEKPSVLRKRAIREARAAASIRHPSIVEIYDVFEEHGTPWIVMAYIEGRTLDRLIESGRSPGERPGLPEREVARIGRHVLTALEAAHRASVLHRDVKPANIVISRDDGVYLVDFGIAHIGGEIGLTSRNVLLGTLEFMAPERIDGVPLSPASDLWSLGVTLFYALEGVSPFRRDSMPATIKAVTSGDPPQPTRPGRLADALARLLDKDPDRRMPAEELHAVLDAILAPPLAASMPSAPPTPTAPLAPTIRMGAPPAAVRPPESVSHRAEAGAALREDRTLREDRRQIGGSPDQIRDRMAVMGPEESAGLLLEQRPRIASAVLSMIEPRVAGPVLDRMARRPAKAAEALRLMMQQSSTVRAARIVDYMTTAQAASLLGALPPPEAASVFVRMDPRAAGGVLGNLDATPVSVRLVEAMTVERACRVFAYVRPATVAELLTASTDGRAERLLNALGEPLKGHVRRLLGRQ